MSNATAGAAALTPRDSRRPVVVRSIALLLAWHTVPACEVILGTVTVAREPIGDSFDGLVLAFQVFLLALSLVISLVILAVLTALGRRRPRLRRVSVLGNFSAATGILLSLASIAWIYMWVATLRAIHS
jgi:hypothetical protein